MKEAVVLWKSLRGEVNGRLRCQHILMEGIAGHPRNPSRQLADIVLLSAHIPRSPRHWRPPNVNRLVTESGDHTGYSTRKISVDDESQTDLGRR